MQDKQITMRVERAFYLGRDIQKVGAQITVERNLAAELRHAGKAVPVQPEAPRTGPMTTESAPAMVRGGRKTGESHAQQ